MEACPGQLVQRHFIFRAGNIYFPLPRCAPAADLDIRGVRSCIVCSPLSKGGNPKFENFKIRGEPDKKKLGWGKPKGGEIFRKKGRHIFQVDFRDGNGRKWG